jgi:hypothetical protein
MWAGVYAGVTGQWLRWYDASGNWVPTKQERLLQAEQQIEEANQRADREQQRAELWAAKLRDLGIDAD